MRETDVSHPLRNGDDHEGGDATVTVDDLRVIPDTDGDGWWDGWIGVHGVEKTDNVVLYMEHLQTGNGIESGEIVQEQTETHTWNDDEHSKVHLGELHWRDFDASQPGDPTDPAVTPDPTLEVEVDYYDDADKTALQVLDDVERNYALYGMEVTFTIDQNLSRSDLQQSFPYDDDDPPTSYDDAEEIESRFHDDTSKLYLFISTDGDHNPAPLIPDWAPDVEGVASSQGIDGVLFGEPNGFAFGALVFTEDHNSTITGHPEGPRDAHLAKTTTHEIGHILGAGREDDGTQYLIVPDEVYSGNIDTDPADGNGTDMTPERVLLDGNIEQEWSVMSGGWNDPIDESPMNGRYIAFSIEELSTLEFNNLDNVDD